jgi:outer membrane protein assembly factor BamB/tetratricopeptide (TPR) repeat protein
MRRTLVGLLGVGCLAALAFLVINVAQGQKIRPVPPIGGPGGGPGGPPGTTPPGTQPGDLSDKGRLILPTDPKQKLKLDAVRDYIHSEDWATVAESVQELLDLPKDVFVQMPVKQADGKEVDTLVGVRVAANRLLGGLPRGKPGVGLEVYKSKHEVTAKTLLTQATADGDKQKFADVAQRYLWTDAGGEAAERLATILLDRGDFMAAAQAFDRLIQRNGIEKLEPLTLYKAAIAFNRGNSQEDKDNKDKVWKQLRTKAPDGLLVAGQTIALDDAEKYLERFRSSVNTSIHDNQLVGYNPSRNGQGVGDTAFMNALLRYSLFLSDDPPSQVRQWVVTEQNSVIKRLESRSEAVIPAFAPITATVTNPKDGKPMTLVVYRDYEGIVARSLKTGKREWASASHWSLEGMFKDSQKRQTLVNWVSQFKDGAGGLGAKPSMLIENSTVGTLSSDGQRAYVIDDLQLPPFHQPFAGNPWGGVPPPQYGGIPQAVRPGIEANKLFCFNIANGKLLWELGGIKTEETPGNLKHDFTDSYFLGAPLPLGGKLYFLNEKKEEIRLVCLDSTKLPPNGAGPRELDDAVAWIQPLGTAKEKILADYGRRTNATHIAYGEGTLVCPTNAGVILGVDMLTHSLLWAHTYSDAPAPPPPGPGMGGMGGFRGGFGGMPGGGPVAPITQDWKSAPPIIADGKVVFTAPDGPELRCLNLRNGAQVWGLKRSENDVYLGGVYAGRVIIVSKKDVRALSLDDARELWRVQTGMPSGRGVASNNVYYVPLKEGLFSDKEKGPGIFAIDVVSGKVVAQTRSKEDPRTHKVEVPGNLSFFDGQVISQSATEIVVYPQLKVKLDLMNELLAKNPNDPKGLYERGELRLDKGERAGAVEDLHKAQKNNPPDDLKPKIEAKLFDAMTELLQHDFEKGQDYLDEYEKLCVVPGGGEEAVKETQRRQASYLCLRAEGRERQGKLGEALTYYLRYGKLPTAQDALLGVVTEPAIRARPDVWARGRIKAMMDTAPADQRKPLEEVIAREWNDTKSSGDLEQLRRFVSMFGDSAAIGKEGRLYLADRLAEREGKADMVDAEAQLLALVNDDDPAFVARAYDGLARLCTRKGLLEDAYAYYKMLQVRFPNTAVRDGKTGTQLVEDLATDKRFLQYMDEPGDVVGKRRFTGDLERDKPNNPQPQHQIFTFDPVGDPLPYLRHHRVGVNQNSNRLKLVDRRTGEDHLDYQLSENFGAYMFAQQMMPNPGFPFNPNQQQAANHFNYHPVGHVVVCNVGQWLVAVDAVNHRKLWEKNLLGDHGPGGTLSYNAAEETLKVLFPDGTYAVVAQGGPVEATYACLLTREGLMALDPLTGKTLWTRSDVSTRCHMFGDSRHIYLVEMNNDGTASTTRAFRAQDGASVAVPNFAALYQKRQRVTGREMLVADTQSAGLFLRLYDVHTGKDLWSDKFPLGTVVMQSQDPDLAGVLAPDGHVTFVSLSQRKVLLKSFVDSNHIKNLKEAHLLADAQNIYVALHVTDPANPQEPWDNLMSNSGLQAITVNGEVYAFKRGSGKIQWHNEVKHEKLVLEQWREMPVLLFTARYQQNGNMFFGGRMPNQAFGDVLIEAYDKTTGKLFFKQPSSDRPVMGQNYLLVHSVSHDVRNGKIELVAQNYKLTITQEGESSAKADGAKEKDTKPAGGTGGAQGTSAPDVPDVPQSVPAQKIEIIKKR